MNNDKFLSNTKKRAKKFEAQRAASNDIKIEVNGVGASPSKIRLLCNPIRRKTAKEALSLLRFSPKKELAIVMTKAINSGLARAQASGKFDLDKLIIDRIWVNAGHTMKRFRPRAQGRAFKIRHRSGNINLVLNEKRD